MQAHDDVASLVAAVSAPILTVNEKILPTQMLR
jgi:hypothetical protein